LEDDGLQRFVPADAQSIRQHQYPDMTVDEIERMIADWNSGVFEGRCFEMFAVTEDGRIAGCASIKECSKSVASLGIEIFTEERGKWIASNAMPLLLEAAKQAGYRAVLDQLRTDNAASIRLHEAPGFETDGYVYRNKRDREVVLYLKLLV
jgi:RimJ/RimL family protein N-acetyltransferase